MGSIVLYIIEWAFALLVLLGLYKAVLSGTTLYRFNRIYLLGATVLSALLPLVHLTITDQTSPVLDMTISGTEFARELSAANGLFAPEVIIDKIISECKTEKIDRKHYRITLWYKQGDETEILIRILSFGPVLKVVAPDDIVSQIRQRLERQFRFQKTEEPA